MPSWHSAINLVNQAAKPLKITKTGLLSDPENLALLTHAHEEIKAGNASQDLTGLSALVAEMESTQDSDLSVSRAVLAQCTVERFKELEDDQDQKDALRLTRASYEDESIPKQDRARERGRCAYEIGRRIDDPLLLEEGAHFYEEAKSLSPFGMGDYRKLSRYAHECLDVSTQITQAKIAIAANAHPETTHVVVQSPIQGASVDPNCWRGKSPRQRAPVPFATEVFGRPAFVLFSRTPPQEVHSPEPERDARGRLRAGMIRRVELIDASQISMMSVSFWLEGDEAHAHGALAEIASDLHAWGERVDRWIDVVGTGLPGNHASHLTRYIYATIGNGGLTPIIADEPGMTRMITATVPTRLSRYDLSFVLNRLSRHNVPLCVEFLRLAQQSLIADDARNSVVEAGTAAESALALHYDHLLGPERRETRWTLGALIQEVSKIPGGLPPGETQASLQSSLVKTRNDAVHRASVTRKSAVDALDACERIVDHVIGLSLGIERLDERLQLLTPWLTTHEPLKGGY